MAFFVSPPEGEQKGEPKKKGCVAVFTLTSEIFAWKHGNPTPTLEGSVREHGTTNADLARFCLDRLFFKALSLTRTNCW